MLHIPSICCIHRYIFIFSDIKVRRGIAKKVMGMFADCRVLSSRINDIPSKYCAFPMSLATQISTIFWFLRNLELTYFVNLVMLNGCWHCICMSLVCSQLVFFTQQGSSLVFLGRLSHGLPFQLLQNALEEAARCVACVHNHASCVDLWYSSLNLANNEHPSVTFLMPPDRSLKLLYILDKCHPLAF